MLLRAWLLVTALYSTCLAADYHEQLILKPLPQSSLLASFNFHNSIPETSFQSQNFETFPRSLGQILLHSHTHELHLRFSTGRWDSETWGTRPWNGSREGGTGVELWAWVEADTEEQANARWLTLTNALSGLFCASLNFIDATRTIRPVSAFELDSRRGVNTTGTRALQLLHGMLPNEVVCTENLTPFLKLLPCKGKAGISSLLDGHKLFDASWQTMSIDVTRRCDGKDGQCNVHVEQTIDMVLNLERAKRSRDDPIPRPLPVDQLNCDPSKFYYQYGDACMPLNGPTMPAFSVSEVFGRPIHANCPATNIKTSPAPLCVDKVGEQHVDAFHVRGGTTQTGQTTRSGQTCFTLPDDNDFDLAFSEVRDVAVEDFFTDNTLLVDRTVSGRGQQDGGIQVTFKNLSPVTSLQLVYLESLPWFMKPHYHTLQTYIRNTTSASQLRSRSSIQDMYYRPAVDRLRGSHLEVLLKVPPASTLTLTYDFEKSILRYTEYPPDANRGFDVASAIVKILPRKDASGAERAPIYMRTTTLLLYLPTPDFSMPYNVIILTSTVIALAFGSLYNVITRRFVPADEMPAATTLLDKVVAAISRVRSRIGGVAKAGSERPKKE